MKVITIIYTLLLIYFSILPFPRSEVINTYTKIDGHMIIIHISAYFFLTMLWIKISKRRIEIYLLAFLLGVVLEIIQPFFNRSASILDIVANGIGISIFYILST